MPISATMYLAQGIWTLFLVKVWSMKRGRGRPRKDSLASNLSNTQNSFLEEGKDRIILYNYFKWKRSVDNVYIWVFLCIHFFVVLFFLWFPLFQYLLEIFIGVLQSYNFWHSIVCAVMCFFCAIFSFSCAFEVFSARRVEHLLFVKSSRWK